jgi:hypothetical protein
MENLFSKVKKSRVVRTTKSAGIRKGISELEILRRAYEIYMETGVPYASEIEGLYEIDKDSQVSPDFKSIEGFDTPGKNQLQL